MKDPKKLHTRRRWLNHSLLALLTCGSLHAQTAAPQSTRTEDAVSSEDETLVLSPFVIEAGEDETGYRATSTLAGTRLRTDIRDVGSAISVITSKFLQDTGSRSNQDLLKYTTNTEVGGVGGNFTGAGNGRQLGEPGLVNPSTNTRVRGLTAADNTRDYFLTEIPWDSYNIGRVDIQRGPNAILFGMGSPAGIINNSTNPASFKNSNRVEVRFDDQGSVRGQIDLNRVILKDELALRLAGVDDHTEYRQKPAYNRDERKYAALRYDPAFLRKNGMSTSLRANFEHGDIDGNRPRSMPPVDRITPWFTQLNRQVYDPIAAWTTNDQKRFMLNPSDGQPGGPNPNFNAWLGGMAVNGGGPTSVYASADSTTQAGLRAYELNNYWGIGPNNAVESSLMAEAVRNNYFGIGSPGAWDKSIEGVGADYSGMLGINSYADWAGSVANPGDPTVQGLSYKAIGAYKDTQITDTGLFDYYNQLIDGPTKHEWQGFETFNIALSQGFFNNRVGLEAVYDRQRYNDGHMGGVNSTLNVDINTVYSGRDGTANPYVGRAYVVSDNSGSKYESLAEAKRATGFVEFRSDDFMSKGWLARVLGRHVFTGMYAEEEKSTQRLDFQKYSMDETFVNNYMGTNPDSNKVGAYTVPVLTYISGDLRDVSDWRNLNLTNVKVEQKPYTVNGGAYAYDNAVSLKVAE